MGAKGSCLHYSESVDKKKLLEFLETSLSSYEIPKELFTVENLEITEGGGWKR